MQGRDDDDDVSRSVLLGFVASTVQSQARQEENFKFEAQQATLGCSC